MLHTSQYSHHRWLFIKKVHRGDELGNYIHWNINPHLSLYRTMELVSNNYVRIKIMLLLQSSQILSLNRVLNFLKLWRWKSHQCFIIMFRHAKQTPIPGITVINWPLNSTFTRKPAKAQRSFYKRWCNGETFFQFKLLYFAEKSPVTSIPF